LECLKKSDASEIAKTYAITRKLVSASVHCSMVVAAFTKEIKAAPGHPVLSKVHYLLVYRSMNQMTYIYCRSSDSSNNVLLWDYFTCRPTTTCHFTIIILHGGNPILHVRLAR
jgi:hypothetical protein